MWILLQAAEHALAATKSALAAEEKTDEAHAAALATHIDGLRAREARIEGPLDRALRDLVDVTSALALAEANLAQWRARDAPARARVRDGTLAAYVAARDKSIATVARARASVEAAKLANGSAARCVVSLHVVSPPCLARSGVPRGREVLQRDSRHVRGGEQVEPQRHVRRGVQAAEEGPHLVRCVAPGCAVPPHGPREENGCT